MSTKTNETQTRIPVKVSNKICKKRLKIIEKVRKNRKTL